MLPLTVPEIVVRPVSVVSESIRKNCCKEACVMDTVSTSVNVLPLKSTVLPSTLVTLRESLVPSAISVVKFKSFTSIVTATPPVAPPLTSTVSSVAISVSELGKVKALTPVEVTVSVSVPAPPEISTPLEISELAVITNVSSPSPPAKVSFPPPITSVSLPPRPDKTSF